MIRAPENVFKLGNSSTSEQLAEHSYSHSPDHKDTRVLMEAKLFYLLHWVVEKNGYDDLVQTAIQVGQAERTLRELHWGVTFLRCGEKSNERAGHGATELKHAAILHRNYCIPHWR